MCSEFNDPEDPVDGFPQHVNEASEEDEHGVRARFSKPEDFIDDVGAA